MLFTRSLHVVIAAISLIATQPNSPVSQEHYLTHTAAIAPTLDQYAGEFLNFYPNGKGKPIRESISLVLPGRARALAVTIDIIDLKNRDDFSSRTVTVRKVDQLISTQIISLSTDWLEEFPERALISEVDDQGNVGLFIPVEVGMQFARYLVLRWESAQEKFTPVAHGAESVSIDIDGTTWPTATLTNPRFEQHALVYESYAAGAGPKFVRCSRLVAGSLQLLFEGHFNYDIKSNLVGDWQLDVLEPEVKTNSGKQMRMKNTTAFTSSQIGNASQNWDCSTWIENLRLLRKRVVVPKVLSRSTGR